MKTRRVVLSQGRDISMLTFVWRWKLATTKTLHARFFQGCTLARAYRRLMDISYAGYIESAVCEQISGAAWTLTRKGFRVIRDLLPDLREEGFKSENVFHDLLVGALQLGDWLRELPDGVTIFSEQQLRRYAVDSYPDWIPKSQAHRPDGYTSVNGKDDVQVTAIEVEISPKSPAHYRGIGSFYAHNRATISQVIWLVRRTTYAKKIHAHLTEGAFNDSRAVHNFVALGDFQRLGWQSPIVMGQQSGLRICDCFAPQKARRSPAESQSTSAALLLLDGQKSYRKSLSSGLAKSPSHAY